MNLWLSPYGIWYYRKATTLPCGRRKEIKKSLHTRSRRPVQLLRSGLPAWVPDPSPFSCLQRSMLPHMSNQ